MTCEPVESFDQIVEFIMPTLQKPARSFSVIPIWIAGMCNHDDGNAAAATRRKGKIITYIHEIWTKHQKHYISGAMLCICNYYCTTNRMHFRCFSQLWNPVQHLMSMFNVNALVYGSLCVCVYLGEGAEREGDSDNV